MTVANLYEIGDKMIVMTTARSKKLSGRFDIGNLPTKCWNFKVKDYHICRNGLKVVIATEK